VDGVNLRVHRDRDGATVDVHHGAGSAGLRASFRDPLVHQAQVGEVGNHRADRRTVQSGPARQLRTRERSTLVNEAEDVGQVVAPQLLGRADGADRRPRGLGGGRHITTLACAAPQQGPRFRWCRNIAT